MQRVLSFVLASVLSAVVMAAPNGAVRRSDDAFIEHARQKLHQSFPKTTVTAVQPSVIPGLAEIYSDGQIFYYAPEQNVLFFGEMYDAGGVSLTQASLSERVAQQASAIDLTEAVAFGEGDTEMIAFVDPDCSYCRVAHQWWQEKKYSDVRTYVFVTPTNGRPSAHARALNLVCTPPENRMEAFRQLFERRNHTDQSGFAICESGEAQLAAQAAIAKKLGVLGTPYFLVKTPASKGYEVVTGFNRTRLDSLLSQR